MAQRDLILLGPPGAGKGTHAEYLKNHRAYVHLSTGDILRAAVAEQTELGQAAQACMEAGELVPDDLVIGVVGQRLARFAADEHFLLDGFPRTVAQAEALAQMLAQTGRSAPLVISLAVSDEEVVRRLSGRRMCPGCGTIYNVARDGLDTGDKCPQCGGMLYQRSDDQAEAIRNRLAVYKQDTQPLIDYYENQGFSQQRGQLVTVDAGQGQEQVGSQLLALAQGSGSD